MDKDKQLLYPFYKALYKKELETRGRCKEGWFEIHLQGGIYTKRRGKDQSAPSQVYILFRKQSSQLDITLNVPKNQCQALHATRVKDYRIQRAAATTWLRYSRQHYPLHNNCSIIILDESVKKLSEDNGMCLLLAGLEQEDVSFDDNISHGELLQAFNTTSTSAIPNLLPDD